jgi:hypothetical protein
MKINGIPEPFTVQQRLEGGYAMVDIHPRALLGMCCRAAKNKSKRCVDGPITVKFYPDKEVANEPQTPNASTT